MQFSWFRKSFSWLSNRKFVKLFTLLVCACLSLVFIILPDIISTNTDQIGPGAVAVEDINAPFTLSYISDILTEQKRTEAELAVSPVYLPSDPMIARTQIGKLLVILNYISIVRRDAYASSEQKLEDLSAIRDMQINDSIAQQVLELNDDSWQSIQYESLSVLEEVMRETIRVVDVNDVKKKAYSLVSYSISEDQAVIVADIASALITPNSAYSLEETEAQRRKAREAVEPVSVSYISGETIVSRGQIITPLIWEALNQFHLLEPTDERELIFSAAIMVSIISVLSFLFLKQHISKLMETNRGILMIGLIYILFLAFGRLIIPDRVVLPYAYPIAAFGLTIAGLYSLEIGLFGTLIISLLAAFQHPLSIELSLYYLLPSMMGILALSKGRRISSFIVAGLTIGAVGSAMILAYRIPDQVTDWIGITTLVAVSFVNGIASASGALILRYILGVILRVVTPFQLVEISRPDHPLLQMMLRDAPGTYQHSLQVANLAERAAEAINADALLTRVGALFHDVGKAINPTAFIENQLPGQENPHDSVDPKTSAEWILQHVTDGIHIARKYHVPPRIQDFIKEHHGTMLTRYQYCIALDAVNNDPTLVDQKYFRYPGPFPQSRETALVMFADGCEARVRAELPVEEEDIRKLVKEQIQFYQSEGQLDHADLSFRDLTLVTESFVSTLKSTHHMRLKYPKIQTQQPASTSNSNNSKPASATNQVTLKDLSGIDGENI